MTEPDKSAKPVSMRKGEPAHADPQPAGRPRTVVGAVAALAVSGVAAFGAAIALYGQRPWLTHEQLKANSKAVSTAVSSAVASASKSSADVSKASASASTSAIKRWPITSPGVHHQVSQQQSGALIGTIVVMVAIAFLASGAYRGRYWSRWGMIAFWFLASFTGTIVGFGSILSLSSSAPAAFKVPASIAALALVVAVVFANLRPSTAYFALSKPAPREGAPARRGLFAPRPPAHTGRPSDAGRPGSQAERAKSTLSSSAASRGEAYLEKQRAKKRNTNAAAVARGAELARSRAKTGKSRRGGSG